MKRALFPVLLVLGLTGCAAPVYNYSPTTVEISDPPLDAVSVAYIGDSMIRQGKYVEHTAIYLPYDIDIGILAPYTLTSGYYLKQGEDANTEFYLPSSEDGGRIVKAALADPFQVAQAHKGEPKLCVVTVFNVAVCREGAKFERTAQAVNSRDAFQQTLIYSGRIGNKINIGYRELSSNMARPAFNNDVEYDLTESRVIGYKGARLEVIEATNEHIKYRVLRNFNSAQY